MDLSPRALAALTRMKKHTLMKGAEIFQNPVTQKSWHDDRSQREHYWNPALRRTGIRRRRAYSTRHTYATRLIMGGIKPAYIAGQLGHSLQMLYTTYARWIDGAAKGAEALKLGAVLGEFGPKLAPIWPQWGFQNTEPFDLIGLPWSGREDSNLRPPAPQADALPGCATPRPEPRL